MLHRASFVLGASESLFGWTARGVVLTRGEQRRRRAGGALDSRRERRRAAEWRRRRVLARRERAERRRARSCSCRRCGCRARSVRCDWCAPSRRRCGSSPARRGCGSIVAGDGPDAEAMLRLAARARRRRPRGARRSALTRASSATLYGRAHVFVLPSERESFGLAALEARAAGLPVVAMLASGVRDFIRQGVDGLLARDDAELARHLSRIALDAPFRALRAASERDDRAAVRLVRRARAAPRDVRARGAAPRLAAPRLGGAGPARSARPEHAGRRERERGSRGAGARRGRAPARRRRRSRVYARTTARLVHADVARHDREQRREVEHRRARGRRRRREGRARTRAACRAWRTPRPPSSRARARARRRRDAAERSGASASEARRAIAPVGRGSSRRDRSSAPRDSRCAGDARRRATRRAAAAWRARRRATINPSAARAIQSGSGATSAAVASTTELGDADEQLIHREHGERRRALQAGQRDEQHDAGRLADEQRRRVEHARRRRHDAQHAGERLRPVDGARAGATATPRAGRMAR